MLLSPYYLVFTLLILTERSRLMFKSWFGAIAAPWLAEGKPGNRVGAMGLELRKKRRLRTLGSQERKSSQPALQVFTSQ